MRCSHFQKGVDTVSFLSARQKVGYSQKQVAMFLGVDQSTVHLWEVGKTNPRAALLPKIAQLYHCTVDELLRKE